MILSVTHRPLTIACLLLAAACSVKEVPYEQEIANWRAQKDAFMQGAAQSPVPPAERGAFAPLVYFPIDPDYRVPAALRLNPTNDILEMPTSTGDRRHMRRIGTLAFTLKGQERTLTAFVDATENDMRRLFVPFGDLTNGTETYTGGRYIDLDRTATGIYDLDFNRAYFPFCYYNPAYDCPVPPRENRLPVPVRAGERMQHREP
jgi:uncharacterized protein (DUF1684 family)